MQEYPIFKYLIQFSNMVDAKGNFLVEVPITQHTGLGMPPGMLSKKQAEGSEDEGVSEKDEDYEGGDSQNGDANGKNHTNG
jgi:hypothetical protein